jgi:tricarballylate dehydrogenase
MDIKKKLGCDVLVIGGGNAGLVAAIEAKNAGANVLLIEKGPKNSRGGNTRLSLAQFRIASEGTNDYLPLLEGAKLPEGELEIEPYPKDEFYNKLIELSEGFADKLLTEIYVERSLETVMWMKEQGVQWDILPMNMKRVGNRLFFPAGQTALMAAGGGESLVETLYGIAEKRGVEVLYQTAARSPIQNADGKVCGIFGIGVNGLIQIDAKAVILACGGFQADPEMRRRCLGENWDLVRLRGTRYNTGDGIQMALSIGAQLTGHWGGCHASIICEATPMVEAAAGGSERYSYPYSIIVNRDGRRFIDEGEDFWDNTYAKLGKEILKQPGSVVFQVFDAKVIPLIGTEYQQDETKVESKSLEQIAEELDINIENFLETIKEYNQSIVNDEKPFMTHKFDGRRTKGLKPDKTNWAQKIDTPPYRAYSAVCGLTMTYGGLKTNEKTQVINTCDHPIEGLYAVGEVTGGFFYHNYPGGTGLVRGAVMGRIAGAEAATSAMHKK